MRVGRALFRLTSRIPTNSKSGMRLGFTPVFDGENTGFDGTTYLTPFGCIDMGVYPKEKAEAFVVGKNYYIEVVEVEDAIRK